MEWKSHIMNVYLMNLQLCDAFVLICPKISVEGLRHLVE